MLLAPIHCRGFALLPSAAIAAQFERGEHCGLFAIWGDTRNRPRPSLYAALPDLETLPG